MDLSTFLQLAVPVVEEEEEHYAVAYWASSPEAGWDPQGYHGEFDGIELAFMNAKECTDSYMETFHWTSVEAEEVPFEQSSWGAADVCCVWLDADASTISELVLYDSGVFGLPSELDDLGEYEGLPTPDEYFGTASSSWTVPEVWQSGPEIWDYDVGVFNIPAHLTGLVECEGLATPEEFFFAAV
jgi:hypothetical protein